MNAKQKELIKIYIFLFVIIYILINWDNVSWLFNYREISGLVSDFFNPYQNNSTAIVSATTESNAQNPYPYADQDNTLEIPSIGLVTPLVIGQSTDKTVLAEDLDKGVVYYPGSVLPGENGQIIVLGHSAPPNWPHIKHDWVFSDINNLNQGDQIILYFNHTKYVYQVTEKNIIKRGQEISTDESLGNGLIIVSCWPPGKDYQRIAVQSQLVKN